MLLFVLVLDTLNKDSLSHSLTLFRLCSCKAKGQLKIDHKTLTDLVYLEHNRILRRKTI